jgi:hypothetical protein
MIPDLESYLKKAKENLEITKGLLILEEMKDSLLYSRVKSALSQTQQAIEEFQKLNNDSTDD